MKIEIVQPYARLLYPENREQGIHLLRTVEAHGRISHRSEGKQSETSWSRFIQALVLNRGDWSITQHVHLTAEVMCDRAIGEEWLRHRIGEYTKESTRFVNYTQEDHPLKVIYPREGEPNIDWIEAMYTAAGHYQLLIGKGWTPEDARTVLPLGTAALFRCTYALSMWRYVFLMRTTQEAHHQIRDLMTNLLIQFQARIPLLYDDIEPGARQRENLKKPR